MNKDQLNSLITKALVGLSAAAFAKYGINQPTQTEIITDVVTFVIGIGTLVYSHFYNSTTTNVTNVNSPSQNSTTESAGK